VQNLLLEKKIVISMTKVVPRKEHPRRKKGICNQEKHILLRLGEVVIDKRG